MPKVFISYSWEDEAHKLWVKSLTDRLIKNGIDATLDQYDLTLGDRLPAFMEQSITTADYVLVICTPTYKEKADNRKGGVGYEGHIISGELFTKGNERKFIPVIRKGSASTALPTYLSGKLGIDLSEASDDDSNFKDLVTTLWGAKSKPALGSKPAYLSNSSTSKTVAKEVENEAISILGIITDRVTIPRMDGTRGSALYSIPFKLSKRPSRLWGQLFIASWNSPPSFSTMHRPGIASVYVDEIILDGTTIEEVRDYHRDTLKLCVDIANKKEAQILERERLKKEQEELRKQKHYNNVQNVANEIKF